MTDRPLRILTVCLGNICRSPTAEAAIREAAGEAGIPVEIDSAGTGSWHIGEPPDGRMRTAAFELGLEIEGRARQVKVDDFDRFDLILAMDRQNYDDLVDVAPSTEAAEKVVMFRSYDPAAEDLDVPDPYYGGAEGFRDVVGIVRAAARGLVDRLGADT